MLLGLGAPATKTTRLERSVERLVRPVDLFRQPNFEIADSQVRLIAPCTSVNWELGPFELWDAVESMQL
jgi:hypothetical protein